MAGGGTCQDRRFAARVRAVDGERGAGRRPRSSSWPNSLSWAGARSSRCETAGRLIKCRVARVRGRVEPRDESRTVLPSDVPWPWPWARSIRRMRGCEASVQGSRGTGNAEGILYTSICMGRMARYPREDYILTRLGMRAVSSGRLNLCLSSFARCRYSHCRGSGGTDGRHYPTKPCTLLHLRDHRGLNCGDGGGSPAGSPDWTGAPRSGPFHARSGFGLAKPGARHALIGPSSCCLPVR